jgi:putative ABC transport system permease protein
MLIIMYIRDELSFDIFHKNGNCLYRITQTISDPSGKHNPRQSGNTPMIAGEVIKTEVPEVKDFVRIKNNYLTIKNGSEVFNERALYVDENFFKVFSFSLITGNPDVALHDPNSVVLTEESAKKYFGTPDVIGKTLQFEIKDTLRNFIVSGVAKNPLSNSSIQFKILLPFNRYKNDNPDNQWLGGNLLTFLLLQHNSNINALNEKLNKVFEKYAGKEISEAQSNKSFTDAVKFVLQPLADIHSNSSIEMSNGLQGESDPFYSYILTIIAIFILVIAGFNFVNLTIAQSLRRTKEIGIRKVIGGMRRQLIIQFMFESLLACIMAFAIAICFTQLILPLFNKITNKHLSFDYTGGAYLFFCFFILLLITAFAAGSYPAMLLSALNPLKLLLGKQKLGERNYFSKSLIVIQFALATLLIFATTVIYKQFNFLTHTDLGYNDKSLAVIYMPQGQDNTALLQVFKNEYAKQSSVIEVGAKSRGNTQAVVETNNEKIKIALSKVDENYIPALQITLKEGRNFSKDIPADTTDAVIVNEAFVKEAGWKTPVGEKVIIPWSKKDLTVIGVIKDYHFKSLKEKITPQMFFEAPGVNYGEMYIRLNPSNSLQTMTQLEQTYKRLSPFSAFEYDFAQDINTHQYGKEALWKKVITYSAILAIFISCIGLLGLVVLNVEQRTKEIGIRKVLGASIVIIAGKISGKFLKLVVLGAIVASPLAWWLMNMWLQNYSYRININWWMFGFTILPVILIAFLTVGFQAIKVAIANPVKSLRAE